MPKTPKKTHKCEDENLKCVSDLEGLHILTKKYDYMGEDIGWFVIGKYSFCPICGEKDDDIKDADDAHSKYFTEGGISLEEVKKTIS